MKRKKLQKNIVEHWRTELTPEERKKRYLESIPEQVSASMAFEGEPVSVGRLKELIEKEKVANKVK
ncbi:MAG: hypothetical protein HZB30_03375 [Nitrospirae bacterium]|nr:hypothetical protein [Nitrospirota bacterium]